MTASYLAAVACLLTVQLLACGILGCTASEGVSWGYEEAHGDGPSKWKDSYHDCGGSSQSPIDVVLAKVNQKPDASLHEPFAFENYDKSSGHISAQLLTNNGHTVQLTMSDDLHANIRGAGLSAAYDLLQFHMHWGSTDSQGSEHFINGHQYPLEIHFVHRKNSYDSTAEALKHPDGLAVLGVFAEVDNSRPNTALNMLIDNFKDIRYAANLTQVAVNPFALNGLLPSNKEDFYRYSGSLTTPPCSEVVTWTLFREPITVSSLQLAALRALAHNTKGQLPDAVLEDNYRPVNPINARTVYSSFAFNPPPPPTTKPASGAAPPGCRHRRGHRVLLAAPAVVAAAAAAAFNAARLRF